MKNTSKGFLLFFLLSACSSVQKEAHFSGQNSRTLNVSSETKSSDSNSLATNSSQTGVARSEPLPVQNQRSENGVKDQTVPQSNAVVSKSNDWELIGDEDSVVTWRKEIPGSDVVAFKGKGFIQGSITSVLAALEDADRHKEWMADIAEARTLETVSEFERIEYTRASVPWPFQDRDFVVRSKLDFLSAKEPTVIIRSWSVEHASAPVKSGIVRGAVYDTQFVLVSKENNTKTEVTLEVFADPKGSIPKWIVNLFQKSWPRTTLERLQKQVLKTDVMPNLHALEWLRTWKPN